MGSTTSPELAARHTRMQQALRLSQPDRLPSGDWTVVEYRPDVYHLGDDEPLPEGGTVGRTRDGQRLVTRDGGVWAVDAKLKYPDHEAVLAADPARFEVEPVAEPMLRRMADLLAAGRERAFPVPMHYGTLLTRATIEFGWEPFLTAAMVDPPRFRQLLTRFGEASLAVLEGWARTPGVELLFLHDDIAATRGLIVSPAWLRAELFPWYRRLFEVVHRHGAKVLYMTDGNYLEVLDDLLALEPDGLYVESSAVAPAELLPRAGRDKLYLIKTDNRVMDFGTPEQVRAEVERLRALHRDYPGMMVYAGGGGRRPDNLAAYAAALG